MGKQKQTTTRTIGAEHGQQSHLFDLYTRLAQEAGGQLGDLSDLAQGEITEPTQQQRAFLQMIADAEQEQARRAILADMGLMQEQVGEHLAERGMQGSTIEAIQQALIGREGQRQLADVASRSQARTGQGLLALPGQMAAQRLSANQALLQRLTSLGNTTLQGRLNQQLAQGTSTTEQGGTALGQALQIGTTIGGAVIGGPPGAAAGSQVGGAFNQPMQPGQSEAAFNQFGMSGLGSLGYQAPYGPQRRY